MALQRSVSPVDDTTPSTYTDAVRRDQSQDLQENFQEQVLNMLGGLRNDMQSMGARVSKLESERTQSVQPRTPKGKGRAPTDTAKTAIAPAADKLSATEDSPLS